MVNEMTGGRIRVGRHAGFCSGVQNALDTVLQETEGGNRVVTLGFLVHNEAVDRYLAERGVTRVTQPREGSGATLVIRAHGVAPDLEKQARLSCRRVVDATCPRVRRLHRLAEQLAAENVTLILLGDPHHPEMEGITARAAVAGGKTAVITSAEELRSLTLSVPVALAAQTTADRPAFGRVKEEFLALFPGQRVYDTLCPETGLRQEEALRLLEEVEAMVVVGSAFSSNTAALARLCSSVRPTCRVADAGELDPCFLKRYRSFGVTAGASTPHWTIKEVVERMENENFAAEENREDLNVEEGNREVCPVPEDRDDPAETEEEGSFAATVNGTEENEADPAESAPASEEPFDYGEAMRMFSVGEQVNGQVVSSTDEEALLDIGYKSEAVLPRAEVYLKGEETLPERYPPGKEIEVTVIEMDDQEGKVTVSHKRLSREKCWAALEDALQNQTKVEGKVKQVVPAGMVIDLGDGLEGFMPGSLVDLRYIPDFKPFLHEDVSFKVIEINREKDKIILSRKKLLEEEAALKKVKTLEALEIGSIVNGTVRRLTDFGAFVDVGGIDGLAHISELSWERVGHPSDVLKVGQEIEVKVLEVIRERERISLSLKQALPDPWEKAEEYFKAGTVVTGKITRLMNFGAFVELKPGLEGLVHVSQIADYHVKHPSEVLSEGEEVEVKILDLRPREKRISLSTKEVRGKTVPRTETGSAAPVPEENGNVTLGDVFGELFNGHGGEREEAASPPSASTPEEEPRETEGEDGIEEDL